MENALNTNIEHTNANTHVPDISDKVSNEVFQSKGGWDVRPNADNSMETHIPLASSGTLVVPELQFSKPQIAPNTDSDAGRNPSWNSHGVETAQIKPGSDLDNFEKSNAPQSSSGTIDFSSPYTLQLLKQAGKSPELNDKPTERPAQDPTAEINYNAAHHLRSF